MFPPVLDPASPDNDVLPRWLEAMFAGEFEEAWRHTDRIELVRRRLQGQPGWQRGEHHLIWNGSDWSGKVVLVRCWHGLGDTIQFLRYLPLVRQRAKQVIVQAQPMLLSLVEGTPGIDVLLNGWTNDPDPPHDVEIECMEFPYAFRHTPSDLPAATPYLAVDRLRARGCPVPLAEGFRVGLVWASSSWNTTRSVPLRTLAPFGRVPGVRWYSLQQGPEQAELSHAPFPITSLAPCTTDLADAAAAMLEMDLIISVDTMAAHLGGALGRPTWTLLKHEADWRWMRHRQDSPWYPTMRLFRQPTPGDWHSAIEQMAAALAGIVPT